MWPFFPDGCGVAALFQPARLAMKKNRHFWRLFREILGVANTSREILGERPKPPELRRAEVNARPGATTPERSARRMVG